MNPENKVPFGQGIFRQTRTSHSRIFNNFGQKRDGIFKLLQSFRIEQIRVQVFFNIPPPWQIGFARRLQARDPPPGQRVRRRIKIQQVILKKLCPQLPGQSRHMHPIRRKPHPSMIMQVPSLPQLPRKPIHHPHRPFTSPNSFSSRMLFNPPKIVLPNLRPLRKPSLPVAPPINLLGELLHG